MSRYTPCRNACDPQPTVSRRGEAGGRRARTFRSSCCCRCTPHTIPAATTAAITAVALAPADLGCAREGAGGGGWVGGMTSAQNTTKMFARTARVAGGLGRRVATSRHASTLVVAEHDGSAISAATLSAVTAANAISAGNVALLVNGPQAVADAASKVRDGGRPSEPHPPPPAPRPRPRPEAAPRLHLWNGWPRAVRAELGRARGGAKPSAPTPAPVPLHRPRSPAPVPQPPPRIRRVRAIGVTLNASPQVAGVTQVLHADAAEVGPSTLAENLAPVVLQCQSAHNFTHIMAGASVNGKNVLPRIAAKLVPLPPLFPAPVRRVRRPTPPART